GNSAHPMLRWHVVGLGGVLSGRRLRARDSDEVMLEPDFDPVPTAVQIGRCGYPAPCRAPRMPSAQSDDSSPEDRCGVPPTPFQELLHLYYNLVTAPGE